METDFENHITFTPDILYEYMEALTGGTSKIGKIIALMMIAGFVLLAVAGYIVKNIFFSVLMLILIPITILILKFLSRFLSRFLANIVFRKHFLDKEGKPISQVTKFADRICITKSFDNVLFYEYKQVTKIYETKNLLILQFGRWTRILLDKTNFISDNSKTFCDYIREKCPVPIYVYR